LWHGTCKAWLGKLGFDAASKTNRPPQPELPSRSQPASNLLESLPFPGLRYSGSLAELMSPGSSQSPADAQPQPSHRALRPTGIRTGTGPTSPLTGSGPGLSPGTTAGIAAASTLAPQTPAVSRRSHAKSKSGCRTCKRRKIKVSVALPSLDTTRGSTNIPNCFPVR
jgi:hypothetical protein